MLVDGDGDDDDGYACCSLRLLGRVDLFFCTFLAFCFFWLLHAEYYSPSLR